MKTDYKIKRGRLPLIGKRPPTRETDSWFSHVLEGCSLVTEGSRGQGRGSVCGSFDRNRDLVVSRDPSLPGP